MDDGLKDERMVGWMDEKTDRWMDDEKIDKLTDGWMNGWIKRKN